MYAAYWFYFICMILNKTAQKRIMLIQICIPLVYAFKVRSSNMKPLFFASKVKQSLIWTLFCLWGQKSQARLKVSGCFAHLKQPGQKGSPQNKFQIMIFFLKMNPPISKDSRKDLMFFKTTLLFTSNVNLNLNPCAGL
jgi:hypothetical protein